MSANAGSTLGLVLSGGGARASYQVGVLSAIAERIPEMRFPIITGVSAGAINAAFLAAHRQPFYFAMEALRKEWLRITPDGVYQVRKLALAGSLAGLTLPFIRRRLPSLDDLQGIVDMRPLRGFLSETIDFGGIDANISAGNLRAVALTATSYATGQTVTFLHGDPNVTVWERVQRTAAHAKLGVEHVMASSAIPLVFPAVQIEGRYYGDGSVRQAAPLSPALHLGAQRLLVIGMRPGSITPNPRVETGYPGTAKIMALLFDSIFLDALDADAERLELVNRLLADRSPTAAPGPLRAVRLLMLRPSRELGELAEGLNLELPSPLNRLVRSLRDGRGGRDFLSYLYFDPAYTSRAMELGYEDTKEQWEKIEKFLTEDGGDRASV
jgi:NTE family protein